MAEMTNTGQYITKLRNVSKEFLKTNKSIFLVFLRYLILILFGFCILIVFFINKVDLSDYQDVVKTILTTTGVTVAIIITFLFTKLFSERNERIERKRLIDLESNKITAFRKMCHFLRTDHGFWKPFGNLKSKMDHEHKHLKLKYYDSEDLFHSEYEKFLEEVNYGESGGQAYVGLREIEGIERSAIVFSDSQLRKNYSLDEISVIHDASSRIWSFFDKFSNKLIPFNTISQENKKQIERNILLINPNYKNLNMDNTTFKMVFDEIYEVVTRKIFLLTQKNNRFLDGSFFLLLLDLFVFAFIIICGIFAMSFDFSFFLKIYVFQVLIMVFIIGVIDLLINLISVIQDELTIDDFYEL